MKANSIIIFIIAGLFGMLKANDGIGLGPSPITPNTLKSAALKETQNDTAILKQIIIDLETAVTTGSKDVWDTFMKDDGVMINRDGKIYSKEELISEITAPAKGRVFRIDVKDIKISIKDNTALATFIADEHLNIWGQKVDTKFRTTDYFERTPAGWKLAMFQYFEVPVDPKVMKVNLEYLKQYTGRYKLSEDLYTDVYIENGSLIAKRNGGEPRQLFPIDQNGRFFFKSEEGERFFSMNEDGSYDLVQRRNWIDLVWKKEKK